MGFSKLSQEIQTRSGQTVALSMPQHGANGIEPGRELLVLVRADFIRAGREGPQTPKPLPRPSESVANLLTKPVTLKLGKVSVQVALESLAKAGSLPLFMSAQSVPLQKREEIVTIDVKAQPVGEVLLQVLDQANCATLAYNSLLLVTLRENVINRSVVLRIHDVRDMTTSDREHKYSIGSTFLCSRVPSPKGEWTFLSQEIRIDRDSPLLYVSLNYISQLRMFHLVRNDQAWEIYVGEKI